ncbi:hypothetical protein [Halorhabdus tiamatea]|uniref:hypothetical protein n=1 Tax=Halorhabdus tiamatea TaxID=430914 RepID=UPI001A7EDA40|nr:hypothetical protein [Halorhabdus tiamatea]
MVIQDGIPILNTLRIASMSAGTTAVRSILAIAPFRCFWIVCFVDWGSGSDSVNEVRTHVRMPRTRAPVTAMLNRALIAGPRNSTSQMLRSVADGDEAAAALPTTSRYALSVTASLRLYDWIVRSILF